MALDSMTPEEFRQLATLLARYATSELDQFEHWRVETPHGAVFIDISRAAPAGYEAAYDVLWPLPERLASHEP
ncbi:hypothetical protein [Actinoplanes sp. NPDC026619]|uniref:hypothetical protein n=1 Tax=Actinoplanes sp. NPDC026619 TaxID=3155798 RepID=UPI0033E343C2